MSGLVKFQKPDKISLYHYIACNNILGTKNLLQSEGFTVAPKSLNEAAMMLADIVRREGDEGLKKIASIHPDKELFISNNSSYTEQTSQSLSADGKQTEIKKGLSEKNLNMLIMAGAGVLALTLVTMMVTKS